MTGERIAEAIAPNTPKLSIVRRGTVTALGLDRSPWPEVDVSIGGGAAVPCRFPKGHWPSVGDEVVLLWEGPDPWVNGLLADADADAMGMRLLALDAALGPVGGITNTAAEGSEALPFTSTVTKLRSASRLLVEVNVGGYSDQLNSVVGLYVKATWAAGSSTSGRWPMTFNPVNTHLQERTERLFTGVPAGSVTLSLLVDMETAGGNFVHDASDVISFKVTEC